MAEKAVIKPMIYELKEPIDDSWEDVNELLAKLQNSTVDILNTVIILRLITSGLVDKWTDGLAIKINNEKISAYKILRNRLHFMHTGNLSTTIKRAESEWGKKYSEIMSSKISIPSFKSGGPIDLHNKSIDVFKEGGTYKIALALISRDYRKEIDRKSERYVFEIIPGNGSSRSIYDNLIDKTYEVGASQLIYKKDKWFILLTYKHIPKKLTIDSSRVLGVDLGERNVAVLAVNGTNDFYIFPSDEIEAFRKKTEKRRLAYKKAAVYCGEGREGHGTSKRLEPSNKISDDVHRFVDTYNHKISRFIVEYAIKHHCGTIQLENLKYIMKKKKYKYLGNWAYYDLKTKIIYKAREKGIQIIEINPRYTSQRCHKCGYIDKNNRRTTEEFICLECGEKIDADLNAARNIAIPGIESTISATCERDSKKQGGSSFTPNREVSFY